jgi:urease accessory protein
MFTLFRNSVSLDIIRAPLADVSSALALVALPIDRFTLAKRRWRGKAADGHEFGFDLERPLRHGDAFFATESHVYRIEQAPEPLLKIALGTAPQSAAAAWQIGNMHFPVQVAVDHLLVEDDPILRQVLEREAIAFEPVTGIFQPLGGAAGHRH